MTDRGDLDEWTATECAEEWGIKPRTWHSYVARGQAPKPDRRVGRTPVWDAETVRAYPRPGRGARMDLIDTPGTRDHPYATTEYGDWTDFDGSLADTPRDEVLHYLGEYVADHDVDAITEEYVEAINAALPEGVSLHGRQLIGPARLRVDSDVIREALQSVDLEAIAQRHAIR